jgi:hypothetical protein
MLPPSAERLNVVDIPFIINVGDKRDMCIGPGCYLELLCDIFLQVDKGKHIRSGCCQHIVTPEYNFHLEFIVPDYTLYQLQAGAV